MAEHWRRSAFTKHSGGLKEGRTYVSRRAILLEAMIAVVDADAEDDRAYHAAWSRFWITMRRVLAKQTSCQGPN